MSWDNIKTLSFIKEYEKRTVLWKRSDKFYYNLYKKDEAWREISEIFDEHVAVLKRKIDSLRGSRRKEKHRALQSKGAGKGWTDISNYISKWFAWDALMFLEDVEELRTTPSNFSEDITIKESITKLEPSEATDDLDWNSDRFNDNEVNNGSDTSKKYSYRNNQASKRKHFDDTNQRTLEVDTQSDECSIFGEYIATKLRKHDDRTRTILQHRIHNILFQAEMDQFSMSESIQMQTPIDCKEISTAFTTQDEDFVEQQKPSTSSQYLSPRSHSDLSHNYLSSPSPTSSCIPSPLQSPQSNQDPLQF
ncbi:hypothetical protein FQR65_LT13231 [Abscondita terminalis]|nr:hypothetical protein FQR65_LT13231 [Abscondita terminalis]